MNTTNDLLASKLSWMEDQDDDFVKEEKNEDGIIHRYDKDGQLHSLYSPALENPDGTKEWWYHGKPHREDGPAFEFPNGGKYWYQNGKPHREDGPAEEFSSGDRHWWIRGKLHRLDGPAIEDIDGDKEWYVNGKRHRLDGPAVEKADGSKKWYINNRAIGKSERGFTDEDFENYKREHGIISSKLSWMEDQDDDFVKEEKDEDGIIYRYDKDGELHSLYSPALENPDGTKEWYNHGLVHRDEEPALEFPNGTKHWYNHGKLHRVDGPALEYPNGAKIWYVNGKLHRLDGPAVELANGIKYWYIDGKFIEESRQGFTDEDFENYKREHGIISSKLSWQEGDDDFVEEKDEDGDLCRYDADGWCHSLHSPAIERADGSKEWWYHGKFVGSSTLDRFTQEKFEKWIKDNRSQKSSSKLSWMQEEDFAKEKKANDGTIRRYDEDGKPHGLYSPAIEYANGRKIWYNHGKLHREDGPAVEYADGTKSWYINDKLYRLDGPAVEYADGSKEWYINGQLIGNSEYGFTQEDFEKYKRENGITASKLSWMQDEDFAEEKKDEDGTIRRYDTDGDLHSLYSPAIETASGTKSWCNHGKYHRLDGPAIEYVDGAKEWWINGKLHREDGPAIETTDGTKEWWINGDLHRLNGPAVETTNGYKAWYINDEFIGESEKGFTDEDFENYKRENGITASKLSWMQEEDFAEEKKDENGTIYRCDKDGKPHSLYSPAIEYADGDVEWYIHGKPHREDGPAVKYGDGTEEWYVNGKYHRLDGPAYTGYDGGKSWWINGKPIGSSAEGFTDEDFENYKRENGL